MRPPERRLALLACAAIIALSGTACTSSTPDAAGSSTSTGGLSGSVIDTSEASSSEAESQTRSVPSSPAIPTPSVIDVPTLTPSSPASSPSSDPAAQEAADRAAVEAQWIKFWIVYDGIVRTPPNQRLQRLEEVTVEPLTDKLLNAAKEAEANGIDNYGTWTHRMYWQTPIAGSTTAILADCQDQSNTGTLRTSTEEILTTGKADTNFRGEFVKSSDGIWRLKTIYAIEDREC